MWLRRYMFLSVIVLVYIVLIHHFHAEQGRFRYITSHLPSVGLGKLTGTSSPWRMYPEKSNEAFCQSHKHLENLGFTRKIKYSRRCIKPKFEANIDRNAITNTTAPLVTHTTLLDINNLCDENIGPIPCDIVELRVSPPDPDSNGQYAHLIFGVATSFDRLQASQATFAHWLADSGATLVGMLTNDAHDLSDRDIASLEATYADARMRLKIVRKRDARYTPEQAHTLVIRDMLKQIDLAYALLPPSSLPSRRHSSSSSKNNNKQQQQQQETKEESVHWLAILDDDTFFPSLAHLSHTLAAHDHTRPSYLGQLTEAASLLPQGILGAFGGAGIFLSTPLARQIAPHLDSCIAASGGVGVGGGGGGAGGDMIIMNCVHAHSAARLERVPGLWQVDLVGDTAGFYESGLGVGTGVLSLHHWKSWHWSPVVDMVAITRLCGGGCFLQRFVFFSSLSPSFPSQQERTEEEEAMVAVVNNGYSINFYTPDTLSSSSKKGGGGGGKETVLPDLSKMEQTWDAWPGTDARKDYEWSLGPLRPKVSTERKKSFWLAMSVWDDGGSEGQRKQKAQTKELTQVYVHRSEEGELDEVIELVWLSSSFSGKTI